MKRILKLLILLSILNMPIFAKITEEEVDEYLEVSRGGQLTMLVLATVYDTVFDTICNMKIENLNEVTKKKYQNFIFNPKYIENFREVIIGIDTKDYTEIMAFYETKLGQKYTQSFKVLYSDDIIRKLLVFLEQRLKNPSSKNKLKLIKQINKVLNEDTFLIDYIGNIMDFEYKREIEKYKLSQNEVNRLMKVSKKYTSNIDNSLEIKSEYIYRDFTDEELLEILEYVKIYGKIELEFVTKALREYLNSLKKDAVQWLINENKSCK